MNLSKHEFVMSTDNKLDECENNYPFIDKVVNEWTMWLDLEAQTYPLPEALTFYPLKTENDYEIYFKVRKEIERPFGLEESIVKSLVKDVTEMAQKYEGQWYIAQKEGVPVGTIGLVPFQFEGRPVGRLKDIQIIPAQQGRGLGNQLLYGIISIARNQGLRGLCLTADADNWPKDWYLKMGFKKVGEVDKSHDES